MAKKDMKAALGKSLQAEEEAVKDRFSRAEKALGSKPDRQESDQVKVEQPSPKQPKPEKPPSEPKKKTVRDSFTMPLDDYELIGIIKERCLKSGIVLNKGEVIRAGLQVLNEMSAVELKRAVSAIERVKTGRPKS